MNVQPIWTHVRIMKHAKIQTAHIHVDLIMINTALAQNIRLYGKGYVLV